MHKRPYDWTVFFRILLNAGEGHVHPAIAIQTESNIDILTEDGQLILIE